jgi:hypothetical protein
MQQAHMHQQMNFHQHQQQAAHYQQQQVSGSGPSLTRITH